MIKKKNQQSLPSFWDTLLQEEFKKETDRGAVILAASLFDIQLETLLKDFLIPDHGSDDELFESTTAPLSSFSAKILMAYRLGLITKRFARDLNLIRKIRNEFAHNIHGCSFEHSSVKSRVHELSKSSSISTKLPVMRKSFPPGTRGEFLVNASWMIWCLTNKTEKVNSLSECGIEFGYIDVDEKELFKKYEEGKKQINKTSSVELPEKFESTGSKS